MATYTVRAGDSWSRIAGNELGNQRYFQKLMRANPGVSSLHPGMKLRLPSVGGGEPRVTIDPKSLDTNVQDALGRDVTLRGVNPYSNYGDYLLGGGGGATPAGAPAAGAAGAGPGTLATAPSPNLSIAAAERLAGSSYTSPPAPGTASSFYAQGGMPQAQTQPKPGSQGFSDIQSGLRAHQSLTGVNQGITWQQVLAGALSGIGALPMAAATSVYARSQGTPASQSGQGSGPLGYIRFVGRTGEELYNEFLKTFSPAPPPPEQPQAARSPMSGSVPGAVIGDAARYTQAAIHEYVRSGFDRQFLPNFISPWISGALPRPLGMTDAEYLDALDYSWDPEFFESGAWVKDNYRSIPGGSGNSGYGRSTGGGSAFRSANSLMPSGGSGSGRLWNWTARIT